MAFNFEKDLLVRELKKIKPKRVLVQLPEGIKQHISEISDVFEELKIETIYSGETCWGGCSVSVQEAKTVGADLIVHFGHAEFMKVDFPVIYIEIRDEVDFNPLMKKSLNILKKYSSLGLSFSVQHRYDVEKVKNFYESNGKKIILSEKKGRAAYPGHVVGCEYSGLKSIQGKVDAFLILGNQFHSMGAVLSVEKPVVILDVYNNDVLEMSDLREKIIKQRAISIDKLKRAKTVGVIIESKLGQNFGIKDVLLKKLKEQNKKAFLITMNEITPDKIMNFYNIECFVELACPRIATDDFAKYGKPILTYREALVALGLKKWEDILNEGFL